MITTIIFDLGGVLIDIDTSYFVKMLSTQLHVSVETIQLNASDGMHDKFMKGLITGEEFYEAACRQHTSIMSLDQFKELWHTILVKQNEPVVAIVNKLRPHYRLALLSNIDPWHYNYCLEKFPIIGTLTTKFLSYEYHLAKPDTNFYEQVARSLKANPAECLFIDDVKENIEGARKTGLNAIHFTDVHNLENELIKRELHF